MDPPGVTPSNELSQRALSKARIVAAIAAVPAVLILFFHPEHLRYATQLGRHRVCWRCGLDFVLFGVGFICIGISGRYAMKCVRQPRLGRHGLQIFNTSCCIVYYLGLGLLLFGSGFVAVCWAWGR